MKILNFLFGRREKPITKDRPEPAQQKQPELRDLWKRSAEIEDSGDVLVDQDYFRKGQIWKRKLSFEVGPDSKIVSLTPRTLEEMARNEEAHELAQATIDHMKVGLSLQGKDGSPSDLDERPGHVVLSELRYESHAENTFTQGALKGNKRRFGKQSSDGETIKLEGGVWGGTWNINSEWNLDSKQLEMTLRQKDYGNSLKEGITWASPPQVYRSEKLALDSEGKIAIPGASSLEEADQIEGKRKAAKRAAEILRTARIWQSFTSSIDQSSSDKNPEPGVVVANSIAKENLPEALLGSPILVEATPYPNGLHYGNYYGNYGVERTDRGTLAIGGSLDNKSSYLRTEKDGSIETITYRPPGLGEHFEVLTLEHDTGIATYEDKRDDWHFRCGKDPY